MPELRTLTIRRAHEIEANPDDPYYPDAIEKYFNRPQDPAFDDLTYPAYFSQFVIEKTSRRSRRQQQPDPSTSQWRDALDNYIYRRKHLQITRSPFRRLADGEPFFYALLLEKRPWRAEQEILGGHCNYRDRFMSLYPGEYQDIINRQQLGRHQNELSLALIYDEIITAILETIDLSLNDIVATQLRNLRPTHPSDQIGDDNDRFDPVLHMAEDQYEVYSIIIDAINGRRSRDAHRLFFVTGSAGTGKSFLLSAIEQSLDQRHINFLKFAPTDIAAVNIGGQTIHSGLSITTCGGSSKSTTFITSMHNSISSDSRRDDLKKVEALLIDEISMVSAELLSFISAQFSRLHGNGRPFGGIMVIVFGDLL